jgi:hypothetical protein
MSEAIERVVVMLDAASDHRAALDTAARLAARWKARLHGIFVEDEDLLRLATLPFARQVSLHGGIETLTVAQVERQLRAFAERTRREVEAAGRHHHVAASFEVVRGTSSAGAATDFFVTGALTRPVGGHFRAEGRWRAGEPAPVLLAHRHWGQPVSVAVLLRGREPRSVRLLQEAARLAEAVGDELTVVLSRDILQDDRFAAWLAEALASYQVRVAVETAPTRPTELIGRIIEMKCQIVAIDLTAMQIEPRHLRDIVARGACDVLLVR